MVASGSIGRNTWTSNFERSASKRKIRTTIPFLVRKVVRAPSTYTCRSASVSDLEETCHGCGGPLKERLEEEALPKPTRGRSRAKLCKRCLDLRHGAFVPGVDGMVSSFSKGSHVPRSNALVSPESLREQLRVYGNRPTYIVWLVDLMDVSGTFLPRPRDLFGSNPIHIVGTKLDLLPKGTKSSEIRQWLMEECRRRRLEVIQASVVSSVRGHGLEELSESIRMERRGRDVAIVGAANVGKSAMVNALLERWQRVAYVETNKQESTVSPVPGTTLRTVSVRAFGRKGSLCDTPGIHLPHRMIQRIDSKTLVALRPRSPLRVLNEIIRNDQKDTFFLGGLVRIDAECQGGYESSQADEAFELAFVLPSVLRVTRGPWCDAEDVDWIESVTEDLCKDLRSVSTDALRYAAQLRNVEGWRKIKRDELLQAMDLGPSTTSPCSYEAKEALRSAVFFGTDCVEEQGGLELRRTVVFESPRGIGRRKSRIPVADVCISGLGGWISILANGRSARNATLRLRVWTPRGVDVFVRPPIPMPVNSDEEGDEEDRML